MVYFMVNSKFRKDADYFSHKKRGVAFCKPLPLLSLR